MTEQTSFSFPKVNQVIDDILNRMSQLVQSHEDMITAIRSDTALQQEWDGAQFNQFYASDQRLNKLLEELWTFLQNWANATRTVHTDMQNTEDTAAGLMQAHA